MRDILTPVLKEIERLSQDEKRILIAIDGRCASGKTTLAKLISENCRCNVIHTDEFFLRPFQRTAKRFCEPGGNLDRERLFSEALRPLKSGEAFDYSPFNCRTGTLDEKISISPRKVNIVEGSYSCHPDLFGCYDLHIFLSVSPEEQSKRIALRNGASAQMFFEKWIPLEEKYFTAFGIESRCELLFST